MAITSEYYFPSSDGKTLIQMCIRDSILALADFRVVVCDQRPDAASQEALPQAAEVYCLPYEDAFAHLPPVTAADYVVICLLYTSRCV